MNQTYYFYKKTVPPDTYDFYDYSRGIVGYKRMNLHSGCPLIFHGTLSELEQHLKRRKEL